MSKNIRSSAVFLKVVEDFNGQDFDETSVFKGDSVEVVREPYEAKPSFIKIINRSLGPANGQTGFIPIEIVRPESNENLSAERLHSSEETNMENGHAVKETEIGIAEAEESEVETDDSFNTVIQLPENKNKKSEDSPSSALHEIAIGQKVVVKFEYTAARPDELDLHVGDIIHVISSPEGGWWRGLSGSGKLTKTGWFPSNLVDLEPDIVEDKIVTADPAKRRTSWLKKVTGKNTENTKRTRSFSTESVATSGSSTPTEASVKARKNAKLLQKRISAPQIGLPALDEMINHEEISSDHQQSLVDAWENNVAPEVFAKTSLQERKKQQVIWEIIFTEKAYVGDIRLIIDVFLKPITEKKLLPPKNINLIFSNIEDIYEVNKEFLGILEHSREENPVIGNIGDIFLLFFEKFMVYTVYCTERDKAINKLHQVSNGTKLKTFLDECNKLPVTRNLDLPAFLIKPPQRICKYPLLIKEVIKYTAENDQEMEKLKEALKHVQQIISIINEGTLESENIKRIVEIQKNFNETIHIASPHRHLLREDAIYLMNGDVKKPRRLFLFNDMIIISQKDWRDKYHLIEKAFLKDVRLNDIKSKHGNRSFLYRKNISFGN
jgi:hypothetical protein